MTRPRRIFGAPVALAVLAIVPIAGTGPAQSAPLSDALAAATRLVGGPAAGQSAAAGHGFVPWPELGTYGPGQKVIATWAPAAKWAPGVIVKVDREDNFYDVEDKYHSVMPYARAQVALPTRETWWTGWFVGDWKVSVPVSMGTTTKAGGRQYQTVTGGMVLPPLRINADGTYSWKVDDNGDTRVLEGHWAARPDAPGVILKGGAEGADWVVYNSTDNVTDRDEIHLSNPKLTYYTATRIDDGA